MADWERWTFDEPGQWISNWPTIRYRPTDENRVSVMFDPPANACNQWGSLHGAFLASFGELLLGIFVEPLDLPHSVVTVSLAFEYPAGAQSGKTIEGQIELMRETGRMQFVRIMLSQRGDIILSGSGILRKVPRP